MLNKVSIDLALSQTQLPKIEALFLGQVVLCRLFLRIKVSITTA